MRCNVYIRCCSRNIIIIIIIITVLVEPILIERYNPLFSVKVSGIVPE